MNEEEFILNKNRSPNPYLSSGFTPRVVFNLDLGKVFKNGHVKVLEDSP